MSGNWRSLQFSNGYAFLPAYQAWLKSKRRENEKFADVICELPRRATWEFKVLYATVQKTWKGPVQTPHIAQKLGYAGDAGTEEKYSIRFDFFWYPLRGSMLFRIYMVFVNRAIGTSQNVLMEPNGCKQCTCMYRYHDSTKLFVSAMYLPIIVSSRCGVQCDTIEPFISVDWLEQYTPKSIFAQHTMKSLRSYEASDVKQRYFVKPKWYVDMMMKLALWFDQSATVVVYKIVLQCLDMRRVQVSRETSHAICQLKVLNIGYSLHSGWFKETDKEINMSRVYPSLHGILQRMVYQ